MAYLVFKVAWAYNHCFEHITTSTINAFKMAFPSLSSFLKRVVSRLAGNGSGKTSSTIVFPFRMADIQVLQICCA